MTQLFNLDDWKLRENTYKKIVVLKCLELSMKMYKQTNI